MRLHVSDYEVKCYKLLKMSYWCPRVLKWDFYCSPVQGVIGLKFTLRTYSLPLLRKKENNRKPNNNKQKNP